jgi:Trk K+ transport system NAD-binding subunit
VGASVNFDLIMQQPWTIAGLIALLMTVKGIILFVLGKFFKLELNQNVLFAVALSQVGEFAFVLFSSSLQDGILPQNIVDIMVAVVAASMALTPLLLLLNDRVIQPLITKKQAEDTRVADTIEEKNPVIIAGFGHFGNTVGRFLRAHGIKATILDTDSERVEFLRKMGFKVYYGDASRYDLLEAAGAAEAKIIIIALEPPEKRLEMIDTIKKHFPSLRMLVRAQNRYDAYDLMNSGMLHVYRETIDTSLRLGVDAMKFLGYRTYSAQRAARTFLKHDEANLKKLAAIQDREEYILTARAYIEELERLMQVDSRDEFVEKDTGWDPDNLITEVRGLVKETKA